MTVLVIADPHIPVPPGDYGGTERIVHALCEGLAERGHTVRLLAAQGSRNYGGGTWTHRAPGLGRLDRAFRKLWFQWVSSRVAIGVDTVVNFGRLDYLFLILRRSRLPLVCWFQNPVSQSEVDWLLARRRRALGLVGISRSQFAEIETREALRIIHNAVDVDQLTFAAHPADPPYYAFLGRLTRNKGVHLAIEAARRAGVVLRLAGTVSKEPGGEEYFEREVRPHLGPGCEWIGPVNDEQKRTLLRGAAALLFPIQWQEPFGIVMIESLACGTPVIAWRLASAPEVIQDGVTGYLCSSMEEMVAAIRSVQGGRLSRQTCRQEAEARFGKTLLVDRCLETILSLTPGKARIA